MRNKVIHLLGLRHQYFTNNFQFVLFLFTDVSQMLNRMWHERWICKLTLNPLAHVGNLLESYICHPKVHIYTEPKISVNTVKRGVELRKFRNISANKNVYSYLRRFLVKIHIKINSSYWRKYFHFCILKKFLQYK